MKRVICLLSILISCGAMAQSRYVRDFKPAMDSLSVLLKERTTVSVPLKLKNVTLRDKELDLYFTEQMMDFPWRKNDVEWFRRQIENLFPESVKKYELGRIFSSGVALEELPMPLLGSDGRPVKSEFARKDPKGPRLVKRVGEIKYPKGMTGRHIALWQSHGRYYEQASSRWQWQRSQNFLTSEDMFTQSFVLPFLIPMLENAGAVVMTPRERDTQRNESVCDNDPAFEDERGEGVRTKGSYSETGAWKDAGTGFADPMPTYSWLQNPFTMGTARQAECSRKATARATWTADIPEAGEYAVYVAYKTLPKSTDAARYTVHHRGGTSKFVVNQRMGGGTWIYLGTFPFDAGNSGSVTLDNGLPQDATFKEGSVVTADGVRFGGGMGKVVRGEEEELSGMPAYMEGALYNMQWSGIDSTVLNAHTGDYTNDYASRGAWVRKLSGGSWSNPKEAGLGIPFDLSLAFHTDAGVTPNDSIIGTLAIYTLKCENSRKLPEGTDRMICREYTDRVQSQIVSDLRTKWNPEWSRRGTWDRSYSESRTTGVPGMLLELLSHQNFADMKYGLDPEFRFDVARAVYKGMLKFMSSRYGISYAVQPLPIHSFAAEIAGDKVRLSWKATEDPQEKTATPKGFILQTRTDDGSFDEGTVIKPSLKDGRYTFETELPAWHVVSYRIIAYNDGGCSFPSEVLAAGRGNEKTVLVVNNFTRLSAPAWFDTPDFAGFDRKTDAGVSYIKDITYIGEQFDYHRTSPWKNNFNGGFGGSYDDEAGLQSAGNTFDFVASHGRSLLAAGYSFISASEEAFEQGVGTGDAWAMDLICGKQLSTPTGHGAKAPRFRVFPDSLRSAISRFTAGGGHVLVSGSRIATDLWDDIYPVCRDSVYSAKSQEFASKVLGYKLLTGHAGRSGKVRPMRGRIQALPGTAAFYNAPNEVSYGVENVDALSPSDKNASTLLRYTDTNLPAAITFDAGGYRAVSIGFPIETLKNSPDQDFLIRTVMEYFSGK